MSEPRFILEIARGGDPLVKYPVYGERLVIGRADSCEIALPCEMVSREHCSLHIENGQWVVQDRSKNGVFIGKRRIHREPVEEGQPFSVGSYDLTLYSGATPADGILTQAFQGAMYEEIIEVSDGVVTGRAVLRVLKGPKSGRVFSINRSRVSVGPSGCQIECASVQGEPWFHLRVVRGRCSVDPGSIPVYLHGQRVRELTPIYPEEQLECNGSTFLVDYETERRSRGEREAKGKLHGSSKPIRELRRVLARVARHDAPVLVWGESGVGKELVARTLHQHGMRGDGPFVAINCASLPLSLMESALFGHEAGAFTGADQRHYGAFQRADGGTLFLDEIGEMAPEAQAKLLRVLESGEVLPVGAEAPLYPDVRIVAATHQDLPELVAEGKFRQDLLFRLAVLSVRVPPLRDRLEDLRDLVEALLAHIAPNATVGLGCFTKLRTHSWPGNVRELKNVLTRAVVLHGHHLEPHHFCFDPWGFDPDVGTAVNPTQEERQQLKKAMREADGNKSEAARILGIPRTSLLYKLRKHKL